MYVLPDYLTYIYCNDTLSTRFVLYDLGQYCVLQNTFCMNILIDYGIIKLAVIRIKVKFYSSY